MEKVDPEGTYRDSSGRLRDVKTKQWRADPYKTPPTSRKKIRGDRSASATPPREKDVRERSRSDDAQQQQLPQQTTLSHSVDTSGVKGLRIYGKTGEDKVNSIVTKEQTEFT
eukprot:223334-Amphidinium_carterae.1